MRLDGDLHAGDGGGGLGLEWDEVVMGWYCSLGNNRVQNGYGVIIAFAFLASIYGVVVAYFVWAVTSSCCC